MEVLTKSVNMKVNKTILKQLPKSKSFKFFDSKIIHDFKANYLKKKQAQPIIDEVPAKTKS